MMEKNLILLYGDNYIWIKMSTEQGLQKEHGKENHDRPTDHPTERPTDRPTDRAHRKVSLASLSFVLFEKNMYMNKAGTKRYLKQKERAREIWNDTVGYKIYMNK